MFGKECPVPPVAALLDSALIAHSHEDLLEGLEQIQWWKTDAEPSILNDSRHGVTGNAGNATRLHQEVLHRS